MTSIKLISAIRILTLLLTALPLCAAEPSPVEFTVKLETVMKHDDGKFLWFHPRAAAIPSRAVGDPSVVMTIQKHLKISDYYSGLHFMTRAGSNAPWVGPVLPPELDWRQMPEGVTISVADVTPGWHAPTGRLLAIGCQVRYSPKGKQLEDVRRAHQTVYAVFDPKGERWTPWQVLDLPGDEQFDFARNACAQWLVKPDGTLLVPLYIGKSTKDRFSTTVAECRFDGTKLTFVRNGTVLRLDVARGLYEPSLTTFQGRYFLTLRNDLKGYVSVSDDGLQFSEAKPWLFDDGAELGSYNTQQHWLAHSDGLFLIYTRRGANNDHIVRHRAPLFMAQVHPETLQIMRRTEKVVVPERGAELGNFGASAISATESWVTVSEGMFMKDSKQRGAEGATFVARILWARPNKLVIGTGTPPAPVK
ncbi:MAG: exo-alpha-sialidase [Verrucomicrobia bacterium]|nr:exo-alpha-sialidase [Verrucomicrobiota bacterium]